MQNYWLQEHISSNFNKILFNTEIVNTKMDVPKQVEDMNKEKKDELTTETRIMCCILSFFFYQQLKDYVLQLASISFDHFDR